MAGPAQRCDRTDLSNNGRNYLVDRDEGQTVP
jgi:hypothetical protein